MSADETNASGADWKERRARTLMRIEGLKREGECYVCRDLETGEVFGNQPVVYEDEVYRVVLDRFPVNPGQAIVTYKPHRESLSDLSQKEASRVFRAVTHITKALKAAVGAKKVYLTAMPDGEPSHLTFQLVPRYPGQPMGWQLLRRERRPLENGDEMAEQIAARLQLGQTSQPEGQ